MILDLVGLPLHDEHGNLIDMTNQERLLDNLRGIRRTMLFDTDWIVLPDSPFTDEERKAWLDWRTMLRNLPDTTPRPLPLDLEIADPPTSKGKANTWVLFTHDR